MAGAQVFNGRHHEVPRQRVGGGHPHLSGHARIGTFAAAFKGNCHAFHVLGHAQHLLAGVRRHQAARGTQEQPAAQRPLQSGQTPAHRSLDDGQLLRRPAQGASALNCQKYPHIVPIHHCLIAHAAIMQP
ncbi:hypothetical protein G6F57_020298 [Rhizopus arrhizus]|nr:hypothetical protein G6F57_020298 [Rhizopus arrhizus]